MFRRALPWVFAVLAVPLAVVPGVALGTGTVDPAAAVRGALGLAPVPTLGLGPVRADGAVPTTRGVLGTPGSPTSALALAAEQIRLAALLRHAGGYGRAQRWVMPLATYTMSEGFGVPGPHWESGYHTGQDFGAAYGETVHAAHRGTVLYAGWAGAYGNLVTIQHEDGTQTWYAHLSRVLVRPGPVRTGQPVGEVGCTGNCFGTHLHFEVRLGPTLAVNPVLWLMLRGVHLPLTPAQVAAQPRTLPEAAELAASPTGPGRPHHPGAGGSGGGTGPGAPYTPAPTTTGGGPGLPPAPSPTHPPGRTPTPTTPPTPTPTTPPPAPTSSEPAGPSPGADDPSG